MRNVQDLRVVITGASSGIGRATAIAFARGGARLVLAARRGDVLGDVVTECESLGAEAIRVVTDVTDNRQVKSLAQAATERFGGIDVWVNNASVAAYGRLLEIPLKDFRRVLDVNLMGYVYGCRSALRAFRETDRGAIINVASLIGEVPQPFSSPYGMAKAGVRSLGATLRQELFLAGLPGISVSTVLPPTVDTPFFAHAANFSGRELMALPPVYPPELIAKSIVHAAVKPKPEINVGTAGRVFVRQHRRHPAAIEAQMAVQTDLGQLSPNRPAPLTQGNLFTPAPSESASIKGGWHGTMHFGARNLMFVVALAASALAATRLARKAVAR